MDYVVQPGDSLWSIARERMGDANLWPEIARLNPTVRPDHLLVGQVLKLPAGAAPRHAPAEHIGPTLPRLGGAGDSASGRRPATTIPLRAFFFVIADEPNPFTRKVVRKVLFPEGLDDKGLVDHIMHPDKAGFMPRDPGSNVSLGRHVLGQTDSRFVSASEHALGSPRFEGQRFWIDVDKAKASGAKLYEIEDLLRDLDRISAKTKSAEFKAYIEDIRQKAQVVDREVIFEGAIPPGAVKTGGEIAATRGLQFVTGVGILLSAYDVGKAGVTSYKKGSAKPLEAEAVRQVGGWGGAWAGAEICGAGGAALGIETGPGALITGAVGSVIGGVAGYFGANWVANLIDHKNGPGGGH